MKTIIRGQGYKLDQHGYLDPPDQWNESFAEGMAVKLGIFGGLTEEHWRFIRYLRGKFTEEKVIPFAFQACADNGLRFKRLKFLFPKGYLNGYEYQANGPDTRNFTLRAFQKEILIFGDTNLDGEVTIGDAELCARAEHGLETLSVQQRYVSDMNSDNKVDAFDALLILRRLRGYIPSNP